MDFNYEGKVVKVDGMVNFAMDGQCEPNNVLLKDINTK